MIITSDNSDVIVQYIGIPDYVVKALSSKRVNIEDLCSTAGVIKDINNNTANMNNESSDTGVVDKVTEFLFSNLSKYDVNDFIAFNILLAEVYKIPIYGLNSFYSFINRNNIDTKLANERLISLYYDNGYELQLKKLTNVSKQETNYPYELAQSGDMVFIIPTKGFTNFVLNSSTSEFNKHMLNHLYMKSTSAFPEEVSVRTNIFKALLSVV